jgi:hypothetical protein
MDRQSRALLLRPPPLRIFFLKQEVDQKIGEGVLIYYYDLGLTTVTAFSQQPELFDPEEPVLPPKE